MEDPALSISDTSPQEQSRACQFCRGRKIKCDRKIPSCTSCTTQKRHCVYVIEAPKPRPSSAIIGALQNEKTQLEEVLIRLKKAGNEARTDILDEIEVVGGSIQLNGIKRSERPESTADGTPASDLQLQRKRSRISAETPSTIGRLGDEPDIDESDEVEKVTTTDDELDVSPFLSIDEQGQVGIFGPSSTLHGPVKPSLASNHPTTAARDRLIANAALQRQREYSLRFLPDIDGVPIEMAIHLLDLHWNRQHHTFLLTYRPAVMRDLIHGGPYCSKFMINAIFACASKYSDRPELRDDPSDRRTAGGRFFRRCTELLEQNSPFEKSSIPTVVGLLLLGSTCIARGEVSKGWLYSGFALRMVYDLGLHLDYRKPGYSAEDLEVRRRVYWGAFICDKLQSLYMGRPIAIQLRDSHVSHYFMDTMEELDLWAPYVDPKLPNPDQVLVAPVPVHSVSAFQQFCVLSKIMTRIINCFYFVGATAANAQSSLQHLDDALTNWYCHLPPALNFQPWSENQRSSKTPPPNILSLNTYHSLVVLLHRPFISDGHLRSISPPVDSWKKCTTAARHITNIIEAYRSSFTLRRAPYLVSYSAYVACTIHVRNAALEGGRGGENRKLLLTTLKMLDEISVPNPGVFGPAKIIRRLMETNGVLDAPSEPFPVIIQADEGLTTEPGLVPSPEISVSPTFDVDAIAKMFPGSSSQFDSNAGPEQFPPDAMHTPQERNDNGMTYQNVIDDSLFGFLDDSSFSNMEEFGFQGHMSWR